MSSPLQGRVSFLEVAVGGGRAQGLFGRAPRQPSVSALELTDRTMHDVGVQITTDEMQPAPLRLGDGPLCHDASYKRTLCLMKLSFYVLAPSSR